MGIYPEDLADILALRDDPDALREYLGEYYGLDDSVIDSFMHGLEQSTFAQTVDPEDADTFIDDVYYAAENSEDESADTGGDTAGSESEGEVSGEAESGGESEGGGEGSEGG